MCSVVPYVCLGCGLGDRQGQGRSGQGTGEGRSALGAGGQNTGTGLGRERTHDDPRACRAQSTANRRLSSVRAACTNGIILGRT